MTHRLRPVAILLLLCASSLARPAPALAQAGGATPPNVVLVLSDTHRWGAMSFTATPQVQTPNLEALASQGISLDRYYVNLPLCTPYRALLLTGRWPYEQGLIANHMRLADRVDMPPDRRARGTLAWAFEEAGYRTAFIGKWHLGSAPHQEVDAPPDARAFGFDTSIVWTDTNNHRASRYSVDGGAWTSWTGRSNATATVDQALEWLRTAKDAGRPLFLIVSLNPPHGPFADALEEKKALYPSVDTLPFHPLDVRRDWPSHRDYHALISGIDDEVGRIGEALEELEIAEDTVLIYTSDHGAMGGVNDVAYGQKRHPNDESTRVPFLIRWPDHIPSGVRLDTLASTIDLFPTLAGLAGLGPRLEAAGTAEARETQAYLATLTGVDLSRRLLELPGAPEPTSVFMMHPTNMNNLFSRPEIVWRAVVTADYTYAVTERDEYALWDNHRPLQDRNLIDEPGHAAIRQALWAEIDRWMRKVEDPFIDRWFDGMAEREVAAWNREHGLGDDNADRSAGRAYVFDRIASRPTPESRSQQIDRPNILIILADDMGYSDIGPYGSEIATPSLDRLAAGGLRFTQFYNTARCSPTRASLLTGLYPHQAGVGRLNRDLGLRGYRGDLAEGTVTIAEVLKGAGYRTLMSGKWHVTHPDLTDDHNWPRQRGFDRYYGTLHGGGNYYNPALLLLDDTPVRATQPDYHYTDAITDHAIEFLEDSGQASDGSAPFFLYVAYTAPHWPLHARPEDIAGYEGRYASGWDTLRRERLERMRSLGLVDAAWQLTPRDARVPAWTDAPDRDWEARRMAVYAAQVTQMDRGIGQILDTIARQGQADRTLVLFLSDNGGSAELIAPDSTNPVFPSETHDGRPIRLGNIPGVMPGPETTYQSYGIGWANASNTPFRLYKHWVHEGGISTPLIAYWPEVITDGGRLVAEPGHVIDLMATVLDVANAEYPSERRGHRVPPLEGVSLRPIFEGHELRRPGALYWEHEGNKAVRRGDWKAVAQYEGAWELYDLTHDRTETVDLAADRPAVLGELVEMWRAWAARVGVVPWSDVGLQ